MKDEVTSAKIRLAFLSTLLVSFVLVLSCRGPTNGEIILKENTKFPEDNAGLNQVEFNGDSLIFSYKSAAAIPQFKTGDILIGKSGDGYLKKVKSTSTSDNTLIVITDQAALTDAVIECHVDTVFPLSASSAQFKPLFLDTTFTAEDGKQYRMTVTSGGGEVKPSPNDFDIAIHFDSVRVEIKNGGTVAAYLNIDQLVLCKSIDVDVKLDVEDAKVVEFKTVASSEDIVEFKGVKLGLEQSISKDIEQKLKTIPFGKIVIMAGPVPIVFLFELGVYAGLGATLSLNTSCEIANDLYLTLTNKYGAIYSNGKWQTAEEKTYGGVAYFGSGPSVGVVADLKAFLKASLDTKIYGVAGPSIYVKPYDYSTVSYPPFNYELGLGISAGVGFKIEILSWAIAEFDYTFLDVRNALINLDEPNTVPNRPSVPSGPSSALVGEPVTFVASTTDPDGDEVAYQFSWGNNELSSWTSFVPSGASGSMTYTYSTPKTYYVMASAKDEHGAESEVSAAASIVIGSGGDEGTLKWRYQTGGDVYSPAISSDGTIYVSSDDGYLYAINPSGTLKWRYQTGGDVYSPAIGSDGTIYVGSNDVYLYAINPSGTLKWRYQTEWFVGSPAIGSDGTIYVGSNYLYAISPSGTLKWFYHAANGVSLSGPAIGSDGTIYISSFYSLYAINPSGSLKWYYESGGGDFTSPAIGPDGTIYVGSMDNYLYAINPSGSLKWRYQTGGDVYSPAIGSDGTIYVGSNDVYLYAINPSGTLKWRYQTEWFVGSPAIGSDGTIYVGSNYLYAISPSGTLKWFYHAANGVSLSGPAIGSDGTIYISSFYSLYAINPSGSLKWYYESGGGDFTSPAIGPDGTIYVGSMDNYLYAINPSGSLKWRYQTGYCVTAPPTIGSDGIIYVGSADYYLYAINPLGLLKWRYQTGYYVGSSNPAAGSDGTIYVGSYDDYLYAITSSSKGLSSSSWPKFRHDNKNTGRYGGP